MTSSAVIMPRSPWPASAAWTKKAGVPVEAKVAAILRPIWPLLPTPLTTTRPLAARSTSTVRAKGSARPSSRAAARAVRPACSVASVRCAEASAPAARPATNSAAASRFPDVETATFVPSVRSSAKTI